MIVWTLAVCLPAPLGETGLEFLVDGLCAGHILGRCHLDGLVEHERPLVCLAPGGHFRVGDTLLHLLNHAVKGPEAVGIPKIRAEGVNIKVGWDEIGVLPGKIVGFFHKGDGLGAHFGHFPAFFRGQGIVRGGRHFGGQIQKKLKKAEKKFPGRFFFSLACLILLKKNCIFIQNPC
jgi:hypothetical protein